MSLFNCHKQQPQPWMSYISPANIRWEPGCCPPLVMGTDALLPFQIISEGDFIRAEIRECGGEWATIDIDVSTIYTEGAYIHSYDGSLDTPLDCGCYEFRVIAGETWWFEPFTAEDFEFTTNSFTARDDLMLPLKFAEQQIEGIPIIAPCDSFLPFMFATENATTGTVVTYLYDAECNATEITIDIEVLIIGGKTYYIHDGACFFPFLECGLYKLEIVDGEHSYMSIWFEAICNMNDIPDGNRAMRDANGCVMRDEIGDIIYEQCYEQVP